MIRFITPLERWMHSSQKNNEFHDYLSMKLKKSTIESVGFMVVSDKQFSVLVNILKKETDIYNRGEILESKEFQSFHNDVIGCEYVFADFDLNIRDECPYNIVEIKYPPTCRICM